MTWIQPIKTSPYTASLTSLWSMGLGRHSPLTRHATVPSALSSEGLLVLLKTTSKSLCYSPCSSELTPPGKRGICGTEAHYYRDSVTLLLAQGGPSRILTYSTSLARFRCPFASLNGIISHRFPQRAFHWSAEPQCISHPSFLDVYCGNVATGAIYNDGRGFRRWSARFGNSASP